jgi:hypothetical protein
VAGVSAADASVRWTHAPDTPGTLTVLPVPGGVLVRAGGTAEVLSAATGTPGARHPAPGGPPSIVDRAVLYAGESTAAVDLAYGRPLWTAPGQPAVAARGPFVLGTDGTLRRLDPASGAVRAEQRVDGSPTGMWLAPGVVVVGWRRDGRTELTALG